MKAATPTRGSTRLSRRGKGEERGGEERGSEPVVVNTPRVLNSLLVKNQEDWHSVSFGARRERVRGESERERWLQVETGDHFGEVDEVRKVMGEERGGEGAADLFERRSYLTVPSMEKLIRDCGKLRVFILFLFFVFAFCFGLCVCLFVYLFICLFVYLFICLFVYLFICLFVYLFICLFIYLFICLFVYLLICLFVNLLIC